MPTFSTSSDTRKSGNTVGRSRYLLRFDDLCPTMNWDIWEQIEQALIENGVKPILAVVPDNRDPKLVVAEKKPRFWASVRCWQDRGWTVALHGYQHRYVTDNAGIVGTRKKSEFAGLSRSEQSEKLSRGIQIFRNEGIKAKVWVAPGHTFDDNTVSLLPEHGIDVISDGFTRFPFRTGTITWIPQQLWEFRPAPAGVWTICFHHNDWTPDTLLNFRQALKTFGPSITELSEAVHCTDTFDWSRWLYRRPGCASLMLRAGLKLYQTTHHN